MSLDPDLIQQFDEQVRKASSVLIGSHLNPDGDALGSAMAMSLYLDEIGVPNEVLCHNAPPRNLEFLPGVDRVKQKPVRSHHDLALVLDMESLDRLGQTRPYFDACPHTIVIDHHVPHHKPGDLRIIDTAASATALIITRIFLALGREITPEIATCLLTGIVTDTGSFRFRNTTPEALSLSAVLLEKGGDIEIVNQEIFQTKPLAAARLMGLVLEHMKLACEDRLAWSTISCGEFAETGSTDEDTEGMANEILTIDTVQIAALFREPAPGKIRLSLRSRRGFDVAAVARYFGGGGHENAAGCIFDSSTMDVVGAVVEKLKECLVSC